MAHMAQRQPLPRLDPPAVIVDGPDRSAPFVVVCEHASRAIPEPFDDLGLPEADRAAHHVWDPGAAELAAALAERLDAPLVRGGISRLVHDLNRPAAVPEAMPAEVEDRPVPGNRGLDAEERAWRAAAVHAPFHAALAALLDARGPETALVTVHSFTPAWLGHVRTEEIGILHDRDTRLADALLHRLPALLAGRRIARNRPYGPQDGVTYTLAAHALPRGLPNAMIEVRNDLLAEGRSLVQLAEALARALTDSRASLESRGEDNRP